MKSFFHHSGVSKIILIGILLLAFFLRIFLLDGQSLWYDEGTSAALATRDLATIAQNAARDIHPPLYYFLLHFWVLLAGNIGFALRFFSLLAGVLLVVVTYRLGSDLFSTRVGLFASFLAAISPFQIYYSQETRMYILVSLWGVLAILLLWRFLHKPKSTIFLALHIGFNVLALYTHYFAFSILLLSNSIFFLWWLRARDRVWIGRWIISQVAIILLYLPWLVFAGGQLFSWPAVSEPYSLPFLTGEVLRLFSLGSTSQPETWVLIFFLFLFFAGLIANSRGQFLPRATALLYFLLPPLLMYLISLNRPVFRSKFLLLATPGFHLLVANGLRGDWFPKGAHRLDWLRKWLGICLAGIIGLITIVPLSNYYFDTRFARDDYRGLAEYITANQEEDDAVLLNAPGQIDIFSYYYGGQLAVYLLPQNRPLRQEKTEESLEQILSEHNRLFAIFWATEESDPQRFIEGWLDEHAFKTLEDWYGGARLVLYSIPTTQPSAEIQSRRNILLGDSIQFLGYNLYNPEVPAGGILQLTLFWEASQPIADRYKVFIHVLDDQERVVGQRDTEPGGGAKITTTWLPGEMVIDNYGVLIPPSTPPEEYQVEVGMYDLNTGERLTVNEEGQLVSNRFYLNPVRILEAENAVAN